MNTATIYPISPLDHSFSVGSTYAVNPLSYGNITFATSNLTTGQCLTTGINSASWSNINNTNANPNLHVTGNAEFQGDIKWKGRSLGKLLEKIEDRLAILAEPDPDKLEKYAALKKAYEQYKLMEKLIGEE